MLKVNNKDTRMTPGVALVASVVNFGHVSHLALVSLLLTFSAANKGQSTVNYRHSLVLDRPYLVMIIVTGGFSKKSFFYYYFYFLEILLNNLELVFLEFKHIYKTQRTSLFSFYLFIFCFLFRNHSVY